MAALAWLDRQYADRIYPNVSVQGVDVGQHTREAAHARVSSALASWLAQPVTLVYQGQMWQPTAAELGLNVDIQQSVELAYRAVRSNGFGGNVRQLVAVFREGLDLPLRITVDGNAVQAYLRRIAAEVEQPAREATLHIDNGPVQVTNSINGRMVLLDATTTDVISALETLQPQRVAVRTIEIPPQLPSAGVTEAQRTVEAMLSAPIELQFGDTSFHLDQATIADMIVFERLTRDGKTVLNAQLDQHKLERWATNLADRMERASVEPRVAWNGGDLGIVQEGRVGYRLDITRTVAMVNGAVTTVTRRLDLPVDEVHPRVTAENLQTLGITELVSTGRSDFTGSAPYRITNIKAGARVINGILVAPGEEFSFNENVGEINEQNGFVEGYAIVGNRTQKEPGGGICQISTTLFRAAFYAGLPFTEKNPHRFRISWYEKYDTIGMDAAIFTGGGPDLRFVNDTGNWLLIESSVNEAASSVTYNLYGTRVPGRTVERSEPVITNETPPPPEPVYIDDPETPIGEFRQTDVARGGMDIEITRVVKQDGAVVRVDTFRTNFAAWPNIYLKNPLTAAPRS